MKNLIINKRIINIKRNPQIIITIKRNRKNNNIIIKQKIKINN